MASEAEGRELAEREKWRNKANRDRPQISCPQTVNVDRLGIVDAKQTQFRVVRSGTPVQVLRTIGAASGEPFPVTTSRTRSSR